MTKKVKKVASKPLPKRIKQSKLTAVKANHLEHIDHKLNDGRTSHLSIDLYQITDGPHKYKVFGTVSKHILLTGTFETLAAAKKRALQLAVDNCLYMGLTCND